MATPLYMPHRGGVESHTAEVSQRLAEDGFEITILTTDPTGALPIRENLGGVQIERVHAWPRGGDLYWSPGIARHVARAQVDLLHCQGYHTFVAPLAMLAARRRRLPYVVTFHSGGHSSPLRRVVRPLQVRMLRPLLRHARRLVAVSEFEANAFRRSLELPKDRISVIPSGVDTAAGQGDSDAPDRDPHLLVSVGRLERYKGHERVIHALPSVRASDPRVRLLILGSGPDERRLKALARKSPAADAIEFDSVPREDVAGILRQAAVAVLLSEYESQGLGAFEALATGCRVVVSDSSALAELVRFRQVRLVSSAVGAEGIADVLLEQLTAGSIGEMDTVGLPTWDECARRLAEVYREVARTPV
jgi:glycogen synthase